MERRFVWQEMGSTTVQVFGNQFELLVSHKSIFSGWAAKNCTYIVQSLESKKIVGLWVADKSMVNICIGLLFFNRRSLQVSSSSKMEPLAAKTIIVNLATEHGLEMDSITTDRSSDLKVMMRWESSRLCVRASEVHSPHVWCRTHQS